MRKNNHPHVSKPKNKVTVHTPPTTFSHDNQKLICSADEKRKIEDVSERLPNKNKPLKSIISETLIIAIIPVVSYAATFAYESGYFGYFKIPIELIIISIIDTFNALFYILSVLLIIPFFASSIFLFFW